MFVTVFILVKRSTTKMTNPLPTSPATQISVYKDTKTIAAGGRLRTPQVIIVSFPGGDSNVVINSSILVFV